MDNKEFNTFDEEFNSIGIAKFLHSKRKILTFIIVISIISFTIISFLIEKRYKSTVVLFPSTSSAISEALLTKNVASKNIMAFGEEEEVEQMLQVLQSDKIQSKIVSKYDLLNHYKLSDHKFPLTMLDEEYKANITFIRTKYMSVVIEVLDKNDSIAAAIANDISAYYDTIMTSLQKERALKAFGIVKNEYVRLENEINSIKDSLKKIEKLGVFDFDSQSEVLNNAYANAILKGNKGAAKQLDDKLNVLAEYGSSHEALSNMLEYEVLRLSDLKAKYSEAKVNAEQQLPHKYVVSSAKRAEKKTYPIRWLIVVIGTLSTLFFTVILLMLFESFKKKE